MLLAIYIFYMIHPLKCKVHFIQKVLPPRCGQISFCAKRIIKKVQIRNLVQKVSYMTLKNKTNFWVLVCSICVFWLLWTCLYLCVVCVHVSVLCRDCRCAVYINYLMYSKWTRLLENFYQHFVCKTPSHFFQQVLQWLLQMCIFLPCVKCCIEAVHFFFSGPKHFLCYCKKFLFLYCMWLPFCTHSFCFQPRKTIKWGLSCNNKADTFSFSIVPTLL